MKRITALLLSLILLFTFAGCGSTQEETVIVVDENSNTSSVGEESMNTSETISSDVVSEEENVSTPDTSSGGNTSSVPTVSTPEEEDKVINIDYEWKSHPEDFKLIALTFDDGPSSLMYDYINLFAAWDGAGTFFVNGYKIDSDYKYSLMQNAINYGWDIGNHGDKHLVATIGGANGGEATYDELKADILNLTNKLETHLKARNGSAYEVSIYRAPNIKPTANTFKICAEEKYPVIWLKYDALDWDTTKTDKQREDVFKYAINTWEDGDVILCHEVQQYADQTYAYLEKYMPDLYRAGYRFCSVTELMELRGITREQICGELNNVDGNRGMVTNIVKAAEQGRK